MSLTVLTNFENQIATYSMRFYPDGTEHRRIKLDNCPQFGEGSDPPFIFDPPLLGIPPLKKFPHPPFLTKIFDAVYQALYTRKATGCMFA